MLRLASNNLELSLEQAESLLKSPREIVAIDIETVSIENPLPVGIALAIDSDTGFYFFNPYDPWLMEAVSLSDTVLAHNASFDVPLLREMGFTINAYEDTMLLAYANGHLDKGLEALSESILQAPYTPVTSQWKKKKQGNIGIDHKLMGSWSIEHALNCYNLWQTLPKCDLYETIDRPYLDIVMEMESWGVLIDQYRLTLVEQATMEKVLPLERGLLEELGIENLNSNPQVAEALRLKGIIGTRKTKSAKDSVSNESLAPLELELTNNILKYRSLMKTISTYLPAFRGNINDKGERQGRLTPDGRLHTEFGYTRTGRNTSRKPNLQNITGNAKFESGEEE